MTATQVGDDRAARARPPLLTAVVVAIAVGVLAVAAPGPTSPATVLLSAAAVVVLVVGRSALLRTHDCWVPWALVEAGVVVTALGPLALAWFHPLISDTVLLRVLPELRAHPELFCGTAARVGDT